MKYFFIIYFAGIVASNLFIAASTCHHPCKKSKCDASPKNCKGGLVLDRCSCCFVCGKVQGESCGGHFFINGRCESGLKCVTKTKPIRPVHQELGICVSKNLLKTAEDIDGPEKRKRLLRKLLKSKKIAKSKDLFKAKKNIKKSLFWSFFS